MSTPVVETMVQTKREREREALLRASQLAWQVCLTGQGDNAKLIEAAEQAGWSAGHLQKVMEGYAKAKLVLDAYREYEASLQKNPENELLLEIEERKKAIAEHQEAIRRLRLRLGENEVRRLNAKNLEGKIQNDWPPDALQAAEDLAARLTDWIRQKACKEHHHHLLREAQDLLAKARMVKEELFRLKAWPEAEARTLWEKLDAIADEARKEFGDLLGDLNR